MQISFYWGIFCFTYLYSDSFHNFSAHSFIFFFFWMNFSRILQKLKIRLDLNLSKTESKRLGKVWILTKSKLYFLKMCSFGWTYTQTLFDLSTHTNTEIHFNFIKIILSLYWVCRKNGNFESILLIFYILNENHFILNIQSLF